MTAAITLEQAEQRAHEAHARAVEAALLGSDETYRSEYISYLHFRNLAKVMSKREREGDEA